MNPSKLLRGLLLTACTLAFIIAAVTLSRRRSHPAEPFAGSLDAAQKITLGFGAAAPVDLIRDSSTWTLNGAGGRSYKADADRVDVLLRGLRALKVEDIISERADSATEYEVNVESGTRVTLTAQGGKVLADGIIGKQAPDFAHLYFKYADKPAIYLARGLIRGDIGFARWAWWRDRGLLSITEDQVLTLVIEGPGFKTALARSSDTWTSNGKLVDPTPVWGLLGVLTHLHADDFIDSPQDAEFAGKPMKYAHILLQLRDGSVQELHVGNADKATGRHPVSSAPNHDLAWVTPMALQPILKKPSEFKPPAPSSPAVVSGGSTPQ